MAVIEDRFGGRSATLLLRRVELADQIAKDDSAHTRYG
jgi:hypothetical protein